MGHITREDIDIKLLCCHKGGFSEKLQKHVMHALKEQRKLLQASEGIVTPCWS